jgi:sec-independent protein translocase protein TatA
MLNLGAPELALIILAFLLLFGYKKLPDASRSIGRSLRIFKSEMQGMKDDDVPTSDGVPIADPTGRKDAPTSSERVVTELETQAAAAEAHAAELRARAKKSRTEAAARIVH